MTVILYDLSQTQLVDLLAGWREAPYRAGQIWEWLYRHLETDPGKMTNLPLSLRERLEQEVTIELLHTVATQCSADGNTVKLLFRLPDGEQVETVLMSYDDRQTLCISSQVGCAMGCVFCATGHMGFRRHLSAGEIVAQVLFFDRELRQRAETLTNIVFMGMGEPLHNYDATLEAVRRLIDPDGFGMGARRITISTVGMVPQIRRLAGEELQVGLAISLHAATDEKRRLLVPAARRWTLTELMQACAEYTAGTGRRVTFEWALIHGENDTPEQAHELGRLVSGLLCHVNLIPLNPTTGYEGAKPDRHRVQRFHAILGGYGVPTTVRIRRGIDIQAGCGQLGQQYNEPDAARPAPVDRAIS